VHMTAESDIHAPDQSWLVSFTGRLSLLFGVLITVLIVIGVRVWQVSDLFVSENAWVAHTLEVKSSTQAILARLGRVQAAGIVYAASGAPLRLTEFEHESPQLDDDLRALADLVTDNPSQVERVHQFDAAVRARRELIAAAVAARQRGSDVPSLPDNGTDEIYLDAKHILAIEDSLLAERRKTAEHTASLTRILTALAVLLSITFLALTFWLMRGTYGRQARAQQTLRDSHKQLRTALLETQRLGDSMQRLAQFGEMLQSCRSMDELREGVPTALAGVLPGIGGRLALLNPSQNLLAIGAHWGEHGVIAESVFAPEDCWGLRRGSAYPAAGAGGNFVCKHVYWPNPDWPAASYLCIPLAAQGQVIGVLTLDAARALDANERRLGIAASEQLALALANLRLQDTLRTQSIRDPLTSLFNRRYLEVSLEREVLRAERRSLPLAVLMLDLDHFKRFNDTFGHDAGDALLAQFGEVLKRCTRSEDIVCRFGGEEFTTILLETNADAARKRAEQIRVATAAMQVEHRQQKLGRVSVSIGIALFPEDARTGDDLLRRADGALYQAKNAGRDRVVCAEADSA
jgi:diguanylate cyclase (GGDEF)-like protein